MSELQVFRLIPAVRGPSMAGVRNVLIYEGAPASLRRNTTRWARRAAGQQEGWPSGLRRTPGKRVGVKAPPGFESPSLRHIPPYPVSDITWAQMAGT